MPRVKFNFNNEAGLQLAGLLETPDTGQPILQYALFANCFTCGKDIAAASRISRALANKGIAVLRFDFTGLGNSDGDFSNTNFSSNVQDLIVAAKALESEYQAPNLLIGHSLGGAAVLRAAEQLPSIKAIATIGSPATAEHIQHLFVGEKKTIQTQGEATVKIGFRNFNIKKQFIDDLEKHSSEYTIARLKTALIIFHSPIDNIVSIDEAAKIYQAARHPKSFISLDNADHLLSNKEDAEYVANTLASWASRYLDLADIPSEKSYGSAPDVTKGEVLITELDHKYLRGVFTNNHQLMADEPISFGGSNLGPGPYELLLSALGTCTSMTLRMYASKKKLNIEEITVRLKHEREHAEDCKDCAGSIKKIDKITRYIHIKGDITAEQKLRLLNIADRCPVHQTLQNNPEIITLEE